MFIHMSGEDTGKVNTDIFLNVHVGTEIAFVQTQVYHSVKTVRL